MNLIEKHIQYLKSELYVFGVEVHYSNQLLQFSCEKKELGVYLLTEETISAPQEDLVFLPIDLLVTASDKIIGFVLSKLQINTVVFARNCEIKKVNKEKAELFFDTYHLMGSTSSASNYGLFYKDELLCLTSFSAAEK